MFVDSRVHMVGGLRGNRAELHIYIKFSFKLDWHDLGYSVVYILHL